MRSCFRHLRTCLYYCHNLDEQQWNHLQEHHHVEEQLLLPHRPQRRGPHWLLLLLPQAWPQDRGLQDQRQVCGFARASPGCSSAAWSLSCLKVNTPIPPSSAVQLGTPQISEPWSGSCFSCDDKLSNSCISYISIVTSYQTNSILRLLLLQKVADWDSVNHVT